MKNHSKFLFVLCQWKPFKKLSPGANCCHSTMCAFLYMEIAKLCFSFLDQQSYLSHMKMFHFLCQGVHPTSCMFRHDSTCKNFLQLPEMFSFMKNKAFHPIRIIFVKCFLSQIIFSKCNFPTRVWALHMAGVFHLTRHLASSALKHCDQIYWQTLTLDSTSNM